MNKKYIKARSAKGVYIFDESGKSYLDGSSGAVTCSLGHTHPKVIEVINSQSGKLQFVYRSQFGSEEAEHLAHQLSELSLDKRHSHLSVKPAKDTYRTALEVGK